MNKFNIDKYNAVIKALEAYPEFWCTSCGKSGNYPTQVLCNDRECSCRYDYEDTNCPHDHDEELGMCLPKGLVAQVSHE